MFRHGKHRKLGPWLDRTGPWRVANDDKEQLYAVQHLAKGELRGVHVGGVQFYGDAILEITGELLNGF